MDVWNEWRRPVCESGDRDLPGEGLGWRYACRKADLDVYTVVGCWVSEKGLGGFLC